MTDRPNPPGDMPDDAPSWSVADDASVSGSDAPSGDGGRTSREWLNQLQSMIDNVATTAGPVMREIAAKAAELAAVAGEKAGPIAKKAAEVTAQAGTKVAERGREVAAELRRDAGRNGEHGSEHTEAPTAGSQTDAPGSPSGMADTAESVGE